MTVSIGKSWLGGAHLVQRQLHSLILSVPFDTYNKHVRDQGKSFILTIPRLPLVWQCWLAGFSTTDNQAEMLTNSHQILYRQALRFFLFLHKKKDYDDKDEKDLLSEICGILSFSFVSFYIFWGKNENGHNAKFCEFNKFLNFR